MSIVIRTHDRMSFKSCREKWNFASPLREDFEPYVGPKPLEFGTAFHEAMEVYYEPRTWTGDREVVEALAVIRFDEVCKKQKGVAIRVSGYDHLAVEIEQDFQERLELGKAMMQQYFKWAKENDNFTPLRVEQTFEVPIPYAKDMEHWINGKSGFFAGADGHLYFQGEPVVYQGKTDLLVEDLEDGQYLIDDHKTAASAGQTQWIAMDDQIGSYVWAYRRMLGLPVKGFYYTEVFKKILHVPNTNKNGSLSVNKMQDTSYELFMKAIIQGGHQVENYQDFLDYLKENPKMVARRFRVLRSEKELDIFQRRLVLEVVDMLSDPSIYPNPNKMNCNGCWFYDPCLAKQEGSDVDFLLKNLYVKRSA